MARAECERVADDLDDQLAGLLGFALPGGRRRVKCEEAAELRFISVCVRAMVARLKLSHLLYTMPVPSQMLNATSSAPAPPQALPRQPDCPGAGGCAERVDQRRCAHHRGHHRLWHG